MNSLMSPPTQPELHELAGWGLDMRLYYEYYNFTSTNYSIIDMSVKQGAEG